VIVVDICRVFILGCPASDVTKADGTHAALGFQEFCEALLCNPISSPALFRLFVSVARLAVERLHVRSAAVIRKICLVFEHLATKARLLAVLISGHHVGGDSITLPALGDRLTVYRHASL
jgi:hypothetical protein